MNELVRLAALVGVSVATFFFVLTGFSGESLTRSAVIVCIFIDVSVGIGSILLMYVLPATEDELELF